MRALVYTAPKTLEMHQAPEPAPRPDQAVLKVIGTGICGSDMTGFLGHSARRQPGLVLGHETIGTVVHVPEGEWSFKEGDRVVVNPIQVCGVCENCRSGQGNICPTWKLIGLDQEPGAFAEYVAIKAANVFPLLPDVPNEQAVMVEPLANGVHLFNLISRHKFGTLAIYGAGTQGILMLALARMLGYREIAIVDTNAARLAVAKQFGAKLVLDAREGNAADAIVEWTNGRGVDIGIDAVGVTAVRQSLVHATRKGGEIMILGLHDAMSDLDFTLIVRNELRVQGSFAFTAHDFAASKRLIENQDICILPWTVTRPLDEGQAAFDMLTTDPGDTLKVILTP